MSHSHIPHPEPASRWDQVYHLRKGTTWLAITNGRLRGCIRKGRGGRQAWVLPDDAQAWFLNGLPTESENVKP